MAISTAWRRASSATFLRPSTMTFRGIESSTRMAALRWEGGNASSLLLKACRCVALASICVARASRRHSAMPSPAMLAGSDERCPWAGSSAAMTEYHDTEWGVPSFDDRHLFEMLTLEGAQSGLSWATILNRRDGYRRAFKDFDPGLVAAFEDRRLERLREDTGIIRNRLKIYAARTNAQAVLRVQAELGSFSTYLWNWVDGTRIVNHPRSVRDLQPTTELSGRISKDLKRRGFTFVGPTIVYSLLEAVGIVDDHLTSCPFKRG